MPEQGLGEDRSSPLGDRAVWAGDQFKQVTVRVVEIDAAAAIEMIDLARPLATEICVMLNAGGADAGERRVKLLFAYQEGVVLRAESLGVRKIEGDPVTGLDRYEGAPIPVPPPGSGCR